MSIPNLLSVVESVRDRYPSQWRAAHRGGPDTDDFIKILAWELHQRDARFGLNGKRGNPEDISDDAICFDGFSAVGDVDPTRGGVPVTVLDVIGAAGGPNPVPTWNAVGPATPRPHAAWVQPVPAGNPGQQPKPEPQPQPKPAPDYTEQIARVASALLALSKQIALLESRVAGIDERLDEDWAARVWTATDPNAPAPEVKVQAPDYRAEINAGFLKGTVHLKPVQPGPK